MTGSWKDTGLLWLVDAGVCQGCNINVATGLSSAIEGSDDIYICENCGKFLVASKNKEK